MIATAIARWPVERLRRCTLADNTNAVGSSPTRLRSVCWLSGPASFLASETFGLPQKVEHWSLTTLREKLVKIGAKVVRHGRYVTFQLAEVAVSSGKGDTASVALGLWYDFHEFGCHLGNVR